MFTVVIKASEITVSEGFGMGLTLRFPRVKRIVEKEEEEEDEAAARNTQG
jgi:ATP-dependent DNA ligase